MMNTVDILNTRISLCLNIKAKSYHTITLFDALNSIRIGTYSNQIQNIRRLYLNGNAKYNSKKKQLPAFIFTGCLYDTRFKFDIMGYTSLLIVDIDKLDNIDDTKALLLPDPYIVSLWVSPSGNGLKALLFLKYSQPYSASDAWILHEHCAFPQVEHYFAQKYSLSIDKTGCDITRMCFVSYDPAIHLKKEFEPFTVQNNLSNNQMHKIRYAYYYGRKNVRQKVKEMQKISKHLRHYTD